MSYQNEWLLFEAEDEFDEIEHDDKPMSINQAKTMYNSLKSDDDINIVVKLNSAQMIEVF